MRNATALAFGLIQQENNRLKLSHPCNHDHTRRPGRTTDHFGKISAQPLYSGGNFGGNSKEGKIEYPCTAWLTWYYSIVPVPPEPSPATGRKKPETINNSRFLAFLYPDESANEEPQRYRMWSDKKRTRGRIQGARSPASQGLTSPTTCLSHVCGQSMACNAE